MTDRRTVMKIAELFQKTADAHHQAFIESDGADPEWPLWYAGYAKDKLNSYLGATLTKSEIVYWVVKLDKEYADVRPDTPWPTYYAQRLFNELAP